MKRKIMHLIILLLAVFCFMEADLPVMAQDQDIPAAKDIFYSLEESLSLDQGQLLLSDKVLPGDSVSDWLAFDAGLLGMEGRDSYLKKIEDYVTDSYASKGCLDTIKTTEYYRIILAVKALGGDPTSCGKDKDGNAVNLLDDGIYYWKGDSLGLQGNNGWIYALLALDASGTEAPSDAVFTREDILRNLLEQQGEDGSIGLTKGDSDIDLTAMALQALGPYSLDGTKVTLSDGSELAVSDAADKALTWLSSKQQADGGFVYADNDEENTESVAQVIMALSVLGKDPRTDEQFVKEDGNLVSSLLSFRLEDGTFSHMKGEDSDAMATEQAMRAILSMEKRENEDQGLYEDIKPAASDQAEAEISDADTAKESGHFLPIIIVLAILAGCGAAIIILNGKRKKSGDK